MVLWGPPKREEMEELQHRLQNVALLTVERLKADFPREDVRSAMQCFDRRAICRGFASEAPDPTVRLVLLRGVKTLANLIGVGPAEAVLQYVDVAPWLISSTRTGQPLATSSNQAAWSKLLCPRVREEATPRRHHRYIALQALIRFYVSIEDGECSVERDLAKLRAQHFEFCGQGGVELVDDKLTLLLNGPRTSE